MDIQPQGTAFEDEAALVQSLKSGEDNAFEHVVRRHGGRLLSVARRFLDEHEARDAVQETFANAFRSIDGFDGRAQLSTWLHRIVVNACLQQIRRRKTRAEVSLDELLPTFLEDGHRERPGPRWDVDAEEIAEREQFRNLVRQSIAKLPADYRSVILLRDIEGFSGAETADMLSITANAVKIRLHRARRALREVLDPEIGKLVH